MDGHDENLTPNGAGNSLGNSTSPGTTGVFDGDTPNPNNASPNPANSGAPTTNSPIFSAPSDTPAASASSTPTAISSSDVAPVDSAEAARVHAALGHPYFSNGPTQSSVVSDSGDIIIGDSASSSKSRKLPRLVIFGLIGVAVMVVIILVVLAISNGAQSSVTPTDNHVVTAAEKKFNQFANYLLYEKDSDEFTGAYVSDKTYKLTENLEGKNINETYWSQANEKLETAISDYTASSSPNPVLLSFLKNYRQDFRFIDAYRQVGEVDNNRLVSAYLSSGESGVETLVTNYYARIKDLGTDLATKYVELKNTQYKNMADVLGYYRQIGCLIDGEPDETCMMNKIDQSGVTADAQRVLQKMNGVSQAAYSADELVLSTVRRLESNCWQISEQFKHPVTDNEESTNE